LFQVSPVWETWTGGWRHWNAQTIWTIPDKPWHVDLIVGNCVLVPSAAFTEAGLMDSKHYPNFGDAEFTPRLKRLGWQLLIDPRARVFCQPNTPPPRIRNMPLKKMFSALIFDLGNNHNLRRRLYGNLAGAPSKIQGLLAFGIFLVRAVTGKSAESPDRSEPPLKEILRRQGNVKQAVSRH
jgi:GT2 family glycosyltransferase